MLLDYAAQAKHQTARGLAATVQGIANLPYNLKLAIINFTHKVSQLNSIQFGHPLCLNQRISIIRDVIVCLFSLRLRSVLKGRGVCDLSSN